MSLEPQKEEQEPKALSPLMQSCEEITADLNAILRDLRDMKKAQRVLETHLLS